MKLSLIEAELGGLVRAERALTAVECGAVWVSVSDERVLVRLRAESREA